MRSLKERLIDVHKTNRSSADKKSLSSHSFSFVVFLFSLFSFFFFVHQIIMNPGHRYLLCVDGSPFSNQVIDHVHSMIKPADNLLVLLAITLEEQRASAEVTMENIKKYMYSQGVKTDRIPPSLLYPNHVIDHLSNLCGSLFSFRSSAV